MDLNYNISPVLLLLSADMVPPHGAGIPRQRPVQPLPRVGWQLNQFGGTRQSTDGGPKKRSVPIKHFLFVLGVTFI